MVRYIPIVAMSLMAGCTIPAPRDDPRPPRGAAGPVALPPAPTDRKCLAELGQSGARFTPVPDRYFDGGCSTLNSVKLANLRGDDMSFSLSNIGPVACPTARALAAWARFGVDRAARQILGSPLARIETMGSYACRNVAGTTRRSAHSRAEAVDIAGFVLRDGRRISVADDWNSGDAAQRQFLRTVHRSACRRFGTVLGPDYNIAHRDHLHLEQGLRRAVATGSDSGFCR